MSQRRADRLSRRSFLAAAGAVPIVGAVGCLGGDTDPDEKEAPPDDWFDIKHWTGTYTYVRSWQQDHTHWSGDQPSFEFMLNGVFDFEYRTHGDHFIVYRSAAPAFWVISGGGSWRDTGDSWDAIFADNGTHVSEWSMNIELNRDGYSLARSYEFMPIEVSVEGSKSAETTGWYEAQYRSTASDLDYAGGSVELPDAVGPLVGGHDWTDDDAPNAIQTRSFFWELSPGRPEPDEPEDHPCDDTDIREGADTAAAETLREGVADGFGDGGVSLGPEHVTVIEHGTSGLLRFSIRLGYTDNLPRHTGECIVDAVARGELPAGVEEGAAHQVVGMLQEIDGRTRVSMRVVDVETGEVVAAGVGDAQGTGRGAIGDAAAEALGELEGFEFR